MAIIYNKCNFNKILFKKCFNLIENLIIFFNYSFLKWSSKIFIFSINQKIKNYKKNLHIKVIQSSRKRSPRVKNSSAVHPGSIEPIHV